MWDNCVVIETKDIRRCILLSFEFNLKGRKNSIITKPTEPVKEGYEFNGWMLDNELFDFTSKVSKDITLVANWTVKTEKKYKITFDSNGGTNVSKQEVSSVATKPKEPTKEGYVFIEWTLDGKSYDFSTKVTKDITLKAKWEYVPNVTYKSNEKIKDLKLISLYDISLLKSQEVVPVEDGKFTISLAIDESLRNFKNYKVIYLNEDGNIEEVIDAKLVDGKVVFTTTHLSTYGVIAYNDVVNQGGSTIKNPQTGDKTIYYITTGIISAVVLTSAIVLKKRKIEG